MFKNILLLQKIQKIKIHRFKKYEIAQGVIKMFLMVFIFMRSTFEFIILE